MQDETTDVTAEETPVEEVAAEETAVEPTEEAAA
jgi:hypothetical protein